MSSNWQAASLRAVLFTQQALPITSDIFSPFAGSGPTTQEDRPRDGIRIQSGEVDDASLRIVISPISVDLTWQAQVSPEQIFNRSFTLGDLKGELAKFENRILSWLPKWEHATTRVSLIVDARAPAGSREEAYGILRDNLKSVQVDARTMRDFQYRVNRRATTDLVPDGYYNRLTTWAAIQLRVSAGQLGVAPVELLGSDFGHVLMDINTPAERTDPLPREKLGPIYRELFQLAAEIAEKGEVI